MNNDKHHMNKELLGYCAVDSGQILLTDPCYIDSQWEHVELTKTDGKKGQYSYNGACRATLSEARGGQLYFKNKISGAGVAISTATGDGLYPVYIMRDEKGRIIKAEITFCNIV